MAKGPKGQKRPADVIGADDGKEQGRAVTEATRRSPCWSVSPALSWAIVNLPIRQCLQAH